MLNFYWLEYSSKDQPWLFSLILYTNWCNFRCYGCHNRFLAWWDYEDSKNKLKDNYNIINVDYNNYYKKLSIEEIELAVKNDFLDMVILCWWEVLIHPLKQIEETINWLKKINPDLLIRIDTNWTFPEKVKYLKTRKLVDWFAIDIKWPYWDNKYHKYIERVIWLEKNILNNLYNKMLRSVKLADWMSYTSFRTVLYPIITENNYFEEIKKWTRNNLKSPHSLNIFQSV